jgi:hypothetical protein
MKDAEPIISDEVLDQSGKAPQLAVLKLESDCANVRRLRPKHALVQESEGVVLALSQISLVEVVVPVDVELHEVVRDVEQLTEANDGRVGAERLCEEIRPCARTAKDNEARVIESERFGLLFARRLRN